MGNLKGKVALVTGGTSGIGRATALALAQAGADVVITGRRVPEGEEVAGLIRKHGVRGVFVQSDVTKETDIRRAIDESLRLTGRLDIAVNNAGLEQVPGPLLETPVAIFDDVFNVNVRGLWLCVKHEIAAMTKAGGGGSGSGGGSIINMSSAAGLVGLPGASVYVASKHAVIGLTKAIALEFAKTGIRVNAVAPAGVDTAMLDRFISGGSREPFAALHPMGRVGKPEEIASAVLWLASEGAGFVTGQTIVLDGGFTAQ